MFQGGRIVAGGNVMKSEGNFVQPTIVEISVSAEVVKEELFAPVLYVMKFQVKLAFRSYSSEDLQFRSCTMISSG